MTHELVHNLTDDEDLPMLIEIIYLLENEQTWRLQHIKELAEQGKLQQQYVKGLEKISSWLGYSSPTELFNGLKVDDLGKLKAIFKEKSIETSEQTD